MTEALKPSPGRPAALVDPDLMEASRILRRSLVRVHPSFRFEERLAAQLGLAAEGLARMRLVPGVDDDRTHPFRDADSFAVGWPPSWRLPDVPRSVLIGGVIASGVSLAGAAYIARRWLTRGP